MDRPPHRVEPPGEPHGCDICSGSLAEPLWRVNGHRVVRCSGCDLVYARVRRDDVEGAYGEGYYMSVYPDYESDRNVHLRTAGRLLGEVEGHFEPGRMVEIGSAFGFFLEAAVARGWDAVGYETSGHAATIARERYGQDVRRADFLDADIEGGVDVVCMLDTIEHLLRPSLFLERAAELLREGGGLVLTTGDISSPIARLCGRRWRMVAPPLHVYYYSVDTLTRLLAKCGFRVVSVTHPPRYQNLGSIIRYMLRGTRLAVPRIPVRVNLGDVMMVVAIRDDAASVEAGEVGFRGGPD